MPVVMEASFVTLYRAAKDVWLDLQELTRPPAPSVNL